MDLHFTESGKQRRMIRAELHAAKPVVTIGKAGLEPSVLASAEQAIVAREAIKIAVGRSCPLAPRDAAAGLADSLGAELVEVKGRTALLYRPQEDDSGPSSDDA